MKQTLLINTARLCLPLFAILLPGCVRTASDSHQGTTAASNLIQPTLSDVSFCEKVTRKIISSSDRDEMILSTYYTPQFAALIRKGCKAPEGMIQHLNYDFIRETQNTEPKPIRLGPGKIVGEKIFVPYVQVHDNEKPFTKTWVFVRKKGKWLAEDILTSDMSKTSDSLYKQLDLL